MTLAEILAKIDELDDELTIYSAEPWSPVSRAVAAREPDDGSLPSEASGMRYLLEVSIAKEAIEIWSQWRAGAVPTIADKCEAVLHYAENDSYLPV